MTISKKLDTYALLLFVFSLLILGLVRIIGNNYYTSTMLLGAFMILQVFSSEMRIRSVLFKMEKRQRERR